MRTYWEHVAKWIGRWTQDQKVLGSIPSAGHAYKCRANFVVNSTFVHPVVMGTWWTDPRLDQQLQVAVRPLPEEIKSEEHV